MNEIPYRCGTPLTLGIIFIFTFCMAEVSAQLPNNNQLPREIQTVLSKSDTDTVKINILLDSANYAQQNNPVQALTYCFYALQMAREVPSEHHIDQALLKIGKFLFHNGAYQEAIRYYQEYQKRALASGNRLNQLKVRHNIIALKLTVNNKSDNSSYSEMKALLKDYEALWEQSGDQTIVREMIPGLLVNLSHTAHLQGAKDEADEFLRKGFELTRNYEVPQLTILQLHISDFVLNSKKVTLAETMERADKIREICEQTQNMQMLTTLEYYLGNALAERGEWEKAITSYENALQHAEKLDNYSLISESANKLYEIYQKKGNSEAALKYNKVAGQARESTKKLEATAGIAQSEMLDKLYELEHEMALEKRSRSIRIIAVGLLSIALVLGSFFLFFRVRKKYHQARIKNEAFAREVNQSTLEKVALNTALEAKDKELTAEIMYRLQKNEIIKEVVQKLYAAQRQQKKDAQQEMAEAIKGLERAMDNDSWDDFELRFLQVHQGFYDRLQELHPKLTINERRLCAFLKLGMSSKEISTLTGQSTESIIKARHRLRKKLGLPEQETSLVEFFANI